MVGRDTTVLDCRHDPVDIVGDASQINSSSREIKNGVRCTFVPVSGLPYTAGINDDSLVEFGHGLLMGVAEDKYVFVTEKVR
jgi:hypothetical protein